MRARENPKDNPKELKVPKAHTKAKHRKLVSQVLKNRNQKQALRTTDTSWNDGWNCDEWNDGWSFDEWHEVWEHTYDTSEWSLSLRGLYVSAISSPKRFEWVKMNLDPGAAVNTLPLNFAPERAGDGIFYRTASGEWIPDGGGQFQGYDENGLVRSLNGRLTGVHEVLCSAAEVACKGRQDFYLGHDGGYMIPIHSKIGQGIRIHFEKLVKWHGKNELIPVFLENNIFNFYPNRGKRGWQSSALVSPTKIMNRNVAPIGDDIEPVGESRADV